MSKPTLIQRIKWWIWDKLATRCDGCPCCVTAWVDRSTGYEEAACIYTGKNTEPEGCLRPRWLTQKRAKRLDDEYWNAVKDWEGVE